MYKYHEILVTDAKTPCTTLFVKNAVILQHSHAHVKLCGMTCTCTYVHCTCTCMYNEMISYERSAVSGPSHSPETEPSQETWMWSLSPVVYTCTCTCMSLFGPYTHTALNSPQLRRGGKKVPRDVQFANTPPRARIQAYQVQYQTPPYSYSIVSHTHHMAPTL